MAAPTSDEPVVKIPLEAQLGRNRGLSGGLSAGRLLPAREHAERRSRREGSSALVWCGAERGRGRVMIPFTSHRHHAPEEHGEADVGQKCAQRGKKEVMAWPCNAAAYAAALPTATQQITTPGSKPKIYRFDDANYRRCSAAPSASPPVHFEQLIPPLPLILLFRRFPNSPCGAKHRNADRDADADVSQSIWRDLGAARRVSTPVSMRGCMPMRWALCWCSIGSIPTLCWGHLPAPLLQPRSSGRSAGMCGEAKCTGACRRGLDGPQVAPPQVGVHGGGACGDSGARVPPWVLQRDRSGQEGNQPARKGSSSRRSTLPRGTWRSCSREPSLPCGFTPGNRGILVN